MAVPTTQFSARKTSIPGLIIFDVTSIGDARGWFQEKYQKAKLTEAGMPVDFEVVQTNVSYNKDPGVIRGFHAEPWDKYISVVSGKVFSAYVDLRPGESFGKVATVELDNNTSVFLPRGIANGFQTLTEAYYVYSVNDHWSQENYDKYTFVNLADPKIGVDWPIPLEKSIMSERDRVHPMLKDVMPMES
ncbi:MAG TPA: dTDP-4-dehydrorhamnose 3,5-epimerase [Candidatus Babeliales bacterium]|nr:dTDP-4-dehydrorhamnose 3,5-epimerase [Candidatus Babeliales bacterium]